jgi:hypothetical protein
MPTATLAPRKNRTKPAPSFQRQILPLVGLAALSLCAHAERAFENTRGARASDAERARVLASRPGQMVDGFSAERS